ncbi:MAG: hypothetical protein KDJ38_03150 [Gammaproteobacteria bacterium]|nr:hypothetical protein [Gammaproteobacteria bacterium]
MTSPSPTNKYSPNPTIGVRFVRWFFISFALLSLTIFVWKRADIFPWIGMCNAAGYEDGNFMSYCHSTRYGDYEHRAFWKELEPGLTEQFSRAEVLFLGNSRAQYAFSTDAIRDFFLENAIPYYVFGFGMGSQNTVPEKMAEKFSLKPAALLINADPFFTDDVSNTNKNMLEDSSVREWEYKLKGWLQARQRELCTNEPAGFTGWLFCSGTEQVLYRNRSDGRWQVEYFRENKKIPVKVDNNQNLQVTLDQAVTIAERFMENLGVRRECMILTVTPRTSTPLKFARQLADRLGVQGIFPWPDNLVTVDDSHLDPDSATRWSTELMRQAGPVIKQCVNQQ